MIHAEDGWMDDYFWNNVKSTARLLVILDLCQRTCPQLHSSLGLILFSFLILLVVGTHPTTIKVKR